MAPPAPARSCALVVRGRARSLAAAGRAPAPLNDPHGPRPAALAKHAGIVAGSAALSPGVVELVVALTRRLDHRPGQQVRVVLGRLPAVEAAPTLRVDGACELNEIVLHLDRADPVAAALAAGRIGPGDLARVLGPFGEAHHRPGSGRLVLAAEGVGFAQAWSIARAARCLEPERPLAFVLGARAAADLYGAPALDWLAGTGVCDLVLCAERGAGGRIRPGSILAHLPRLRPGDVVHASGSAATVAAVADAAAEAGARCHGLPVGRADAAPPRPALIG